MKKLCAAFKVSRSGYYEWLKRPIKVASGRGRNDANAILSLYEKSRCNWAVKRISGTLKA